MKNLGLKVNKNYKNKLILNNYSFNFNIPNDFSTATFKKYPLFPIEKSLINISLLPNSSK